jgi:metal-responsive CopG/Arc/MetJ family transcriptional regulator
MERKRKRRYVAIPEEIAQRIDRVKELQGYDSLTDFVKDACRRRLEQFENFQEGKH